MIFMKVKDDYNLGCYQNWEKKNDKVSVKIDFLFKLKIKRAKNASQKVLGE